MANSAVANNAQDRRSFIKEMAAAGIIALDPEPAFALSESQAKEDFRLGPGASIPHIPQNRQLLSRIAASK